MSIELLLIPLGMAALSALKEHRRTDLCEGCRQTRLTDVTLVIRALQELGATHIVSDGNVVTARSPRGQLRLQLIQGIFLGRVDGGTEAENLQLASDVDEAAGRLVQADKVEEMRTRAAQLGLVLVGEDVADDGTVQLVFEEAE
jgi:hypothetical protein